MSSNTDIDIKLHPCHYENMLIQIRIQKVLPSKNEHFSDKQNLIFFIFLLKI